MLFCFILAHSIFNLVCNITHYPTYHSPYIFSDACNVDSGMCDEIKTFLPSIVESVCSTDELLSGIDNIECGSDERRLSALSFCDADTEILPFNGGPSDSDLTYAPSQDGEL